MDTEQPKAPQKKPRLIDSRPGLIQRRKRQRVRITVEPGSPRAKAILPGGASGSSPLINVNPSEMPSGYQQGKKGRPGIGMPWRKWSKRMLYDKARRMGWLDANPMPPLTDRVQFARWVEGLHAEWVRRQNAKVFDKHPTSSKMAAIVIHKFGGVRRMAEALDRLHMHSGVETDKRYRRRYAAINTWQKPIKYDENGKRLRNRPKGTDGIIPYQMWNAILRAARYEGILLRFEDFFPELA